MLSAAAAAFYLVVAALCLLAARAQSGLPKVGAVWLAIAMLFLLLAGSRAFGLEESLRGAMRSWLQATGEYGGRRSLQALFAALLVGMGGLATIGLLTARRGNSSGPDPRGIGFASYAAAAMIGLVGLRLISLHAVDALLYGPLHLNWLIDMGASAVVAACAWTSRHDVRRRRDRRRAKADGD